MVEDIYGCMLVQGFHFKRPPNSRNGRVWVLYISPPSAFLTDFLVLLRTKLKYCG